MNSYKIMSFLDDALDLLAEPFQYDKPSLWSLDHTGTLFSAQDTTFNMVPIKL